MELAYRAIKERLQQLSDIKVIEEDMMQDRRPGMLRATPALLIGFMPVNDFDDIGSKAQQYDVEVYVRLVHDTKADKRIEQGDVSFFKLLTGVHQLLHGYNAMKSDIEEYAALAGQDGDMRIFASMRRVRVAPVASEYYMSYQLHYRGNVKDFSAEGMRTTASGVGIGIDNLDMSV